MAEYLFELIGTPVICGLGLIANFLSAIVLSLQEMRSPFNVLLLGLTFFDSTFLLSALADRVLTAFGYSHVSSMVAILSIGRTGSIYCTLVISLERLLAVYWPFRSRARFTMLKAKLSVFAVLIVAILLNAPLIWYKVLLHTYSDEQLAELGPWILGTAEQLIWFLIVSSLFIPFSILLVINILIYIGIRRARRNRAELTILQRDDASITILLLCIVLVFGICYVPYLMLMVLGNINSAVGDFGGYEVLGRIGNMTAAFNSSINFLIYFATTHRFRRGFVGLWSKVKNKLTRAGTKSSMTSCTTMV